MGENGIVSLPSKIYSVLTLAAIGIGGYLIWKNWDSIIKGFCSIPGTSVAFPQWCEGGGPPPNCECQPGLSEACVLRHGIWHECNADKKTPACYCEETQPQECTLGQISCWGLIKQKCTDIAGWHKWVPIGLCTPGGCEAEDLGSTWTLDQMCGQWNCIQAKNNIAQWTLDQNLAALCQPEVRAWNETYRPCHKNEVDYLCMGYTGDTGNGNGNENENIITVKSGLCSDGGLAFFIPPKTLIQACAERVRTIITNKHFGDCVRGVEHLYQYTDHGPDYEAAKLACMTDTSRNALGTRNEQYAFINQCENAGNSVMGWSGHIDTPSGTYYDPYEWAQRFGHTLTGQFVKGYIGNPELYPGSSTLYCVRD